MTKLIENTFRHVNIALMNELAIFSNNLGVNIWEAIDAASTKPYGFMPFRPGPGVGGHCLPIDPSYLSWHVKKELSQNFRFVELANEINTNMPEYVVQRANQMLNSMNKPIKNSSVVLLGLSYKKNSSDTREAPAIKIANILSSLGANIYGYDMHVPKYAWPKNITKIISNNDIFSTADIAIVLTDHDDIVVLSEALTEVPILDTKNVFSGKNITKL
jgi:nucleotide sugar dehydrogenase